RLVYQSHIRVRFLTTSMLRFRFSAMQQERLLPFPAFAEQDAKFLCMPSAATPNPSFKRTCLRQAV
ncbi:MAG: hypothetical protein ABUU24_08010, partial [Variovorax sp.]